VASAFHIENFGCRAARADGEAVGNRLRAAGLSDGEPGEADLVVVNTCSVTAEADRAARAFIRRAHRRNPEARIVVTGCYAQRAPEELAGIAGVSAVVGNSHKALAPAIALQLMRHPSERAGQDSEASFVSVHALLSRTSNPTAPIFADDRFAHSFLEEAQLVPGEQTRPNLKVQEGCGNRCTFCVIPQTRGRSRSLAFDSILRQVRGFVEAGGNELVLSGINLGRWGRDLLDTDQPRSLAELVRAVLTETALPRLRLSSVEPMDWDTSLIELMRTFGGSRLARHAHLPLQSGSDAVLRRMHRRYRPWHYAQKVEALLAAGSHEMTLGADVMVGFPGETDAEFQETVNFIQSLPFGYLHLFPFSPRPGTRGWALHAESPVPNAVVDQRLAVLREFGAQKTRTHRAQFLGRELEVVTLHTPEKIRTHKRTTGLSENFLPVEIQGSIDANLLQRVRIVGMDDDFTLRATISR
jgi:threonylcarbamoyladenosine tRNA methylthiotransferase MtaB